MRIGIIGAGGMGRWFAHFFSDIGIDVTILDHDPRKAEGMSSKRISPVSSIDRILSCDAILIAVSLSATKEALLDIKDRIDADRILIDISSFKKDIADVFLSIECKKLSIHPMFGPSARSLQGENLLVVRDLSDKKAMDSILSFFDEANIHECSLNEHEETMSLVLGVPYAMNNAFYEIANNVPPCFHGPTFRKQLSISRQVSEENPDLSKEAVFHSRERIRQYLDLLSK